MDETQVNGSPAQEPVFPLPGGVNAVYFAGSINSHGSITFLHDRRSKLEDASRLRDYGPFFATAQSERGETLLARGCLTLEKLESVVLERLFKGKAGKPDSPRDYFKSVGQYFSESSEEGTGKSLNTFFYLCF